MSATFNAGTGGVGCSDEFRYSTRTGVVWSGPYSYLPGDQLSTGGINEIIIEGRRAGCNVDAGCTETSWVTLAQWTITPDPTPPVISTCAADKFYDADPSCQIIVPELTSEIVASDNCDPDPEITQSPLAGSTIGEGVTTVTITVTDAAGNTTTCTADITVTDVSPPTFTAPADITIYTDTDCNYDASVSETGDVTDEADNCGVGDATFVDAVDATDPTNIIVTRTWSLTDDHGNAADDQVQLITVRDNTPPVITGCPADINTAADTGYCGTEVTWIEPTVSDNCPGVILTSTHNPGDFFPVGTTTVTYTATDACGLTDICEFDVIVADASPPVISGSTEVCTPVQNTYSVVDPGTHTFSWEVTSGTISGSATDPVVTVEWTGTAQGILEVTITSASGCTSTNSITVDKFETPTIGNINSSKSLIRR